MSFGENFVHQTRSARHRRSDFNPRGIGTSTRSASELGQPMRLYLQSRPNSAFRYQSGRTPVYQEPRETSSSDEFESVMERGRYAPVQRSRRAVNQAAAVFSPDEIYYFTIVQMKPDTAIRTVEEHPPPSAFWDLKPNEKAAFLFYFHVYGFYFKPLEMFVKIFNREFYNLTCSGLTDEDALIQICDRTYKEHRREQEKLRKEIEDQRSVIETPSESQNFSNDIDSDDLSLDSSSKEVKKFTSYHAFIKFCNAGRVLHFNPKTMQLTLKNVKTVIKDRFAQGNIELLEQFQGPLSLESTQNQSVLLFIRRQMMTIKNTDIYLGNPNSNDTNDCILVWRLLEVVVKQQGRVTGADLAELLCKDQIFPKKSLRAQRSTTTSDDGSQENLRNEHSVPSDALEQFTNYLLGGHVDEAIKCAENAGLLFDALVLAYRMYSESNTPKLEQVLQRLLAANRSPHHPAMTLYSVAASQPVPLLMHSDTDDGRGWRAHIAIVLANLKTDAAIDSIVQLGRSLAAKEFNSAADFCFLAANLLSDRDCFSPDSGDQPASRTYIELINATLPDDDIHSQRTRFGWSILDFCATEIFEYALRLKYHGIQDPATNQPLTTPLSKSLAFQKRRLEFAQLLNDYGGFAPQVSSYCVQIAQNVWNSMYNLDDEFIADLTGLAEEIKFVGAQPNQDQSWIQVLKDQYTQYYQQNPSNAPTTQQSYHSHQNEAHHEHHQPSHTPHVEEHHPVVHQEPVREEQDPVFVDPPKLTSPTRRHRPLSVLSQQSAFSYVPPSTRRSYEQESSIYARDSSVEQDVSSRTVSEVSEAELEHRRRTESVQSHQSYGGTVTPNVHSPISTSTPVPPIHQVHPVVQPPKPQPPHPVQPVQPLQSEPTTPHADQQFQYHPQVSQPQVPQVDHQHQYQPQPQYDQYVPQQQWQQPVQQHPQIPQQPQYAPQAEQQQQPASQLQQYQNPQQLAAHQLQQAPQQLQQQQKGEPKQEEKKIKQSASTGGFFGGITKKLAGIIPASNAMRLPDDSKPTIRWDPALNKYVGEGVEEEVAPPPPPMGGLGLPASASLPTELGSATIAATPSYTTPAMPAPQVYAQPQPVVNQPQQQALVSAANPMFTAPVAAAPPRPRLQKGSKGFVAPVNGFATTSSGAAPPAMSMMPTMPTQQGTMGFGFIPQAVETSEFSPFSDTPNQPDLSQQPAQ